MTIKIGTCKNNSPREVLAVLIHEITEICCVEMGVRSVKCLTKDDYMFVMDHEKFSLVLVEVTRVLADLMKL